MPDLSPADLALLTAEEIVMWERCNQRGHGLSNQCNCCADLSMILTALVQARREHVKQLALIGGMCGHPDAAEACRLIAKKCHDLTAACWPGTEPG